jgi:hypothetical protein
MYPNCIFKKEIKSLFLFLLKKMYFILKYYALYFVIDYILLNSKYT